MDEQQKNRLFRETDERGNTALNYAAKAGNLALCKFLYNKENKTETESSFKIIKQWKSRFDKDSEGASLVAEGQNKMTPVQFAARYGDKGRGEQVWNSINWIFETCEKKESHGKKEKLQ